MPLGEQVSVVGRVLDRSDRPLLCPGTDGCRPCHCKRGGRPYHAGMCYSAQIEAEYRKYQRLYDARIDVEAFVALYWNRLQDARIKIPLALDLAFTTPETEWEHGIRVLIDQFKAQQTQRLEQELFKQRKRLADAERTLQTRTTKAALESRRIATAKTEWILGKLADLRRTTLQDADARIYPGHYAPVLVVEGGERVIKPMRYQCRPAGKPPGYDTQYPGTYNARRDNLQGFWKEQFGYTHGIMVVNAFYEHVDVAVPGGCGETENRVLEFKPQPQQDMLVACLWSRWTAHGEPELYSFAAITDEPPPEVAAAGLDRCIIPIKPEHMDAWLNPEPGNLAALYAILDDREQPYYEHRMAA